MRNPFILCFISGVVTGMGNGSVFGAALMCFLGRGKFDDWGGWFGTAYDPTTFTGFVDWAMIIFGLAFYLTLHIAVNRHNQLEAKA
ncbi:MAG: hypothetical protein OEZ68_16720 [Gammaproteobacteria bacterium]|nr:hypothetical protein [Gammaproteobacteria bacterium]MDH5802447.1 hypothetical protein [Gammaproteobacteria bacterium]